LAGGSGFLGRALTHEFVDKGYEVVILTRSPAKDAEHVRYVAWNGRTLGDWATFLDGAQAVVNLTGKSVNCRYTPANRREIVDSRVDSVKVLGEAIVKCSRPPKVFVQAASLAIYGDAGQRICDENAPAGTGFSVETCLLWEKTVASLQLPSTRKVVLRIGFALGPADGALGTLARVTKCYLGGTLGTGNQYISWIHLQELNRMFLWSIERDNIEGVFNATGPNPVTNTEFMRELRRTLNRPWSPPVPAWAVHIGAWSMGSEAELALTGRRCVPQRLLDMDFEFKYSNLEEALRDLQL
jgi:uncharacterized protein (TIGR01777 family)